MKQTILIIAFLLTCLHSHAQLGFGPEIGVGGSNMKFAPNSAFTSSGTTGMASARIGGMIDVPFSKDIYFQSGLSLSHKGHSRHYSFSVSDSLNDYEHRSLSLNYIDLPLTIVFKSRSQGKGRAFFGIGATMSYLLGGTNKLDAHGRYNDTAFTINSQSSPDAILRKFDIGVNLSAGYELPTGLYFKVFYLGGVKDLGLTSEIDKNRMWGIGTGYIFGKGRNVNKDTEGLIDKSTD